MRFMSTAFVRITLVSDLSSVRNGDMFRFKVFPFCGAVSDVSLVTTRRFCHAWQITLASTTVVAKFYSAFAKYALRKMWTSHNSHFCPDISDDLLEQLTRNLCGSTSDHKATFRLTKEIKSKVAIFLLRNRSRSNVLFWFQSIYSCPQVVPNS